MLTKLEKLKACFHEKAKNNKAFTLIELIIVIVIIGILVAVSMANMGKNTDDSKIARAKSDIRLVAGALDRYYADTGDSTLSGDLKTICEDKLSKQVDSISGDKVGPYLKTCPVSPWEKKNYTVSWDKSTLTYNIEMSFADNKCLSSRDLSKVHETCPTGDSNND